MIKMNDYFEFETDEELELWREELRGQLSDGQYENSYVNWEFWIGLETEVGDETKVHSSEQIEMNTKIDFTELGFLFTDKATLRGGVRSKYTEDDVLPYLEKISEAMNDFAIIDENYNPYKED